MLCPFFNAHQLSRLSMGVILIPIMVTLVSKDCKSAFFSDLTPVIDCNSTRAALFQCCCPCIEGYSGYRLCFSGSKVTAVVSNFPLLFLYSLCMCVLPSFKSDWTRRREVKGISKDMLKVENKTASSMMHLTYTY